MFSTNPQLYLSYLFMIKNFVDEHGVEYPQRRRLTNPRSEIKIYEVIDAVCPKMHKLIGTQLVSIQDKCKELIERQRDAIEDYAYHNGPGGLQEHICVDMETVCPRIIFANEEEL
eukprot:TRINITY_DN22330_c0_g3_i1.p3 TRINITY_DN22330_c0_g3~~TRINITY_DN22330_c0_g3_i1.p3  ORF type:complete len:115 (+),score=11.49 TRINITY_DN22330_c0_g3_i1:166-510(+)